MEQHPVQCRNGCGFYSNAGTDGLCSVCYKDIIKKKQQPPQGMPASLAPTAGSGAMASLSIDESGKVSVPEPSSPIKAAEVSALLTASPTVILPSQIDKSSEDPNEAGCSTDASAATPSTSEGAEGEDKEGGKKKKNRCLSCKKKVGLTGFTCRCGGLFCPSHRYSDKHDCTFDYREHGADQIRRSNPVVVAKKVQQI